MDGLSLVDLIHTITQKGYTVAFSDDFEGMITVTFGGMNMDWRHHQHLGIPGGDKAFLAQEIFRCVKEFKEEFCE